LKKKLDSDLVEQLRKSKEKVGALLPVLVSAKTGRIIDGQHRIRSDKKWPVMKLNLDEKQSLIARLSINTLRHPLEPLDFNELAALLVKEGVRHGQVAKTISDLTGISYAVVLSNLDSGFKLENRPHLSKEQRQRRIESRTIQNDEQVIESSDEPSDVEQRVSEAVEEYSHETARAYDALSVSEPIGEAKSQNGALHHDFIYKINALHDACGFIDLRCREYYASLDVEQKQGVKKKVDYVSEQVKKLVTSCE
jgi:ParB-like chromosome segregation protein Spo0J